MMNGAAKKATERIHPGTRLGRVHYTVANLEQVAGFYRDILGFRLLWQDGATAALGAGERELLRLTEVPGARRVRRTTGLYHTAFLVPTRRELAHLLRRIIETRTPIQGHSNHGTHLAIYLPDPEGNGIELAWDFPREVWPMKDGLYDLSSTPRTGVDLRELLGELDRDPSSWEGLHPDTVVGHVHLHVADLGETEAFYHGLLGMDVTLLSHDFGALFLSAGGYHHHVGSNIWLGPGAPPAPEDATGLRYFTIVVPDGEELARIRARLDATGVSHRPEEGGIFIKDPSSIGVLIKSAA